MTIREAAPDRSEPDLGRKSAAPVAENDRANEPVEMDLGFDMDL